MSVEVTVNGQAWHLQPGETYRFDGRSFSIPVELHRRGADDQTRLGVPSVIVCPRCEGQLYDRGSCGMCANAGYLDNHGSRLSFAQRMQILAVFALSAEVDLQLPPASDAVETDSRLELARQRAMLILRIARETWRSPQSRLSQIEHEAEHFYFVATGTAPDVPA